MKEIPILYRKKIVADVRPVMPFASKRQFLWSRTKRGLNIL